MEKCSMCMLAKRDIVNRSWGKFRNIKKYKLRFQHGFSKMYRFTLSGILKFVIINNTGQQKKIFLRPRIGCKYFLIKRWR